MALPCAANNMAIADQAPDAGRWRAGDSAGQAQTVRL